MREEQEADYAFKLKNMGINECLFEKYLIIKSDKIRKVYSDSAIAEVDPMKSLQNKRSRELEDIYDEVDNEYNPYQLNDYECSYEPEENNETISDKSDGEEEDPHHEAAPVRNHGGLEIFENCSKTQIDKLHRLVSHHQSKAKTFVRAYKSKLKSKHQEIYVRNSQEFVEKIKHKIFHKCNFPGCNRTFASSGWLKSHFNEHDNEILSHKFNKIFDNFLKNSKIN